MLAAVTDLDEGAGVAYRVGELAELAGISIRTLHYYEEIGLLRPATRTEAGYRLYERPELERLQEILFYRELGLPLETVKRVVTAPGYDRRGALEEQRKRLWEKKRRVEALMRALDRALANEEKGTQMDEKDMFEVFGDFDPREHEEEARERWGRTDAYKESARRTAAYGKEDWERIKAEGDAINRRLVELAEAGASPQDPEVQDVVERHWRSIDDNFYDCPPQMYRALGEMYVEDARFKATYDALRPGLAVFLRDAIRHWAAQRERP